MQTNPGCDDPRQPDQDRALGTAAIANQGDGVVVDSSLGTTIGGTTVAARNVISGGAADGVTITGSESMGVVVGNYIGTTADGTTGLGNTGHGVDILGGASMNTVGGLTAGARNVIGGNLVGVDLEGESSSTTVEGNYVGTTADGSAELSNLTGWSNEVGVNVVTSSNNLIGGTASGAGNVISGNRYGVLIEGTGLDNTMVPSANNVIQGNLIGTNALGTAPVPNILYGINLFQDIATTVGGTAAGASNVISDARHGLRLAPRRHTAEYRGLGHPGRVGHPRRPDRREQDRDRHHRHLCHSQRRVWRGGQIRRRDRVRPPARRRHERGRLRRRRRRRQYQHHGVWTGDDTVSDGFDGVPGSLTAGAGYAPGLSGDAFSFDGVSGAFSDVIQNRVFYHQFGADGTTYSGWVKTTDADGTLMTDGGGVDTATGTGLFVNRASSPDWVEGDCRSVQFLVDRPGDQRRPVASVRLHLDQ